MARRRAVSVEGDMMLTQLDDRMFFGRYRSAEVCILVGVRGAAPAGACLDLV